MNMLKSAPMQLAAGVLALSLVTACTKSADDQSSTTTTTETSSSVVTTATPDAILEPAVDPNASASGSTTAVDSGTATETTDAMSGAAPATTVITDRSMEKKTAVKRHAKHGKAKAKKTTTRTETTRSDDVGAVSPIYNSGEESMNTDDISSSGSTSAVTEISAPMATDLSMAPGRAASALTDWGVDYKINDAAAAGSL